MFNLPVLKGRAGADGARGMPGESGAKVPNASAQPLMFTSLNTNEKWEALSCAGLVTSSALLHHRVTEALMDSPDCLVKRDTG